MSGLFWLAGPVWAGEWSCADLGEMARTGQQLRERGALIAQIEAQPPGPVEQAMPPERQAALRAALRLGYFSGDDGASLRASLEAICRSGVHR